MAEQKKEVIELKDEDLEEVTGGVNEERSSAKPSLKQVNPEEERKKRAKLKDILKKVM